jgi:microcystin-dependent protein
MKIQYILSAIVLLLYSSSFNVLHAEDFVFKTVLSKEVSKSIQPPSSVDCDGNATSTPDPIPYTAVEIMQEGVDFTRVSFRVYYSDDMSTPLYNYLNNTAAAVNFDTTSGEISYTMTGIAQTRKALTARVYLNATGTGSPFQEKEFYTSQAKTGPPIGSIMPFYGTAATAATLELGGWFLCDGRSIASINDNVLFPDEKTALQTVIGSPNLPDLRGLFLRGIDPAGGTQHDPDADRAVGNVQSSEIQGHSHNYDKANSPTASANANVSVNTNTTSVMNNEADVSVLTSASATGGDHSHTINHTTTATTNAGNGTDTRPVNAAVNYLIKVRH